MRIHQELTIQRSPETVFRWIENPQLASRWQPDVAEYEITKAVSGVAGTEFRELIRDARGSLEMRGRVSAYVPNVMMEFDLAGRGIRLQARYTLSPTGSGSRLVVDTHIRLGGWLSFLIEPWVRRKMARQLAAELQRLRALCEAEPELPRKTPDEMLGSR